MVSITECLYSIVLEYLGGTYIAQVSASDEVDALFVWVRSIPGSDAVVWRLDVAQLAQLVRSEKAVPLDKCINAWCLAGNVGNHLALINIFKTAVN
jgi:hypothetical protein